MLRRLDIAIAQLSGLSRPAAKELINNGGVRVNNLVVTKPGLQVGTDDIIEYTLPDITFVSRGGYKLLAALEEFGIDLRDHICLDVGASTGGFTDCMLQRGASLVYAIDVGTAQLHPTLRTDTRIHSLENTNILDINPDYFSPEPTFATVDVSFVSSTKILPHLASLNSLEQIVVLVKPQFEVGKTNLSKSGIVRNEKTRKKAVDSVIRTGVAAGLHFCGSIESPISGGDGNIEYLALFSSKVINPQH